MKTIEQIRVENVRREKKKVGKNSVLADLLEMNESLLSKYTGTNPSKKIGDTVARDIEKKLGLELGWLDNVHESDAEQPPTYTLESIPICDSETCFLEVDGSQFAGFPMGALLTIEPWTEYHDQKAGFALIRPNGRSQAVVCLVLDSGAETIRFAQLVGGQPMTHQDFVYSKNDAEILGAIAGAADLQFERK